MLPIIEFITDIYEKNSDASSHYYGICQRFARISKLICTVGFGLYLATLLVTALPGTCKLLLTGDYEPTMLIHFPGVYEYTGGMLVASLIFNHFMVVICLLTIPPGDMFFFIVFANMPMVPAVVQGHLDQLTKILEQQRDRNRLEIKRRMVQYIQMQRRYNE